MTRRDRAARPGLEPVWEEVARRLGASDRPVVSVTVPDLPERSRAALADLLGLDRMPPASPRVRMADLARAVGAEDDASFRGLVEELVGPIPNRAAERAERRAEREALWVWVADQAERLDVPSWATWLRSLGVPGGDIDRLRARIEAALAVLERVLRDAEPDLVLAHLANDVLGDPHALDPGQPVAGLVVEALSRRSGTAAGDRRAEVVRALWASAGVATDTLSPTVLVYGLRSSADDPVASTLGAMADAGEPAVLTARQLQRWPVRVDGSGGGEVLVVENPSVVAHFAASNSPISVVCTGGWPNVAVLTLLRQLAGAGLRLRCHADFDPAGILIVRFLGDQVGAEPWAMTARRYLAVVDRSSVEFSGSVADTPWDPELAEAMRTRRKAVFEEDVRHSLTAAGAPTPSPTD